MSADPMMGVDPETMGPMAMPEEGVGAELPLELMEQMGTADQGVDPNSAPADPMLAQEPPDDPYGGLGEFETRERVELGVLLAIESCAKAIEVGEGAANPDFVMKFAQASASLGQTYASLTAVEQNETANQAVVPEDPFE